MCNIMRSMIINSCFFFYESWQSSFFRVMSQARGGKGWSSASADQTGPKKSTVLRVWVDGT